MKVAVGLMTFNMFATKRDKMFWDSLAVLREEFKDVLIYTYGSTDGTGQKVESLGGHWTRAIDGQMASRYSTTVKEMGDMLYATGADIIFITADDIVYKPGIKLAMENWWTSAPKKVAITSWILEPSYPWNYLIEPVSYAGIQGYSRGTVPGCSWSFLREDWPALTKRPLFEDVGICNDLLGHGRSVVQVDWGDHVGEKQSAWGNESWKSAMPFDPKIDHRHEWEHIGMTIGPNKMSFACHVKDCTMGVVADGSARVTEYVPNMYNMVTDDKKLDIEDDPNGTIAKGSYREIFSTYELDKLGDEVWEDCIFVDIGANVGVISSFVALHHPEVLVYSYEPDAVNYKLLERNINANASFPGRCHIFNLAVTSDGRDVYVIGARSNPGGITIYAKNSPYDKDARVMSEVKSTTLDDIFKSLPPHKHLILKIDTEGAEHEILAPPMDEVVSKEVDHLCIEYHNVPGNKWSAKTLSKHMRDLMGDKRVHEPAIYLMTQYEEPK